MENVQLAELNLEMDVKRYNQKKKMEEILVGGEKKVKWSKSDVCCVHGLKIYLSNSVQFLIFLIISYSVPSCYLDQHFRYSLANH